MNNIVLDDDKLQEDEIQEPRWDVPQGKYRATLKRATAVDSSPNACDLDSTRLCFSVQHPQFKNRDYWAGRNFRTNFGRGSGLRHVARCLRGGVDLTEDEVKQGTVNLEAYIGKQVDLELVHIKNKKHQKPYVFIQNITPAGSLVPDVVQAAVQEHREVIQITGLN